MGYLPPTLVFVCIGVWVLRHASLLFGPNVFLPRDNFDFHLPMFEYLVNYLRLFHRVPDWVYTLDGGVWLAPLVNNFLLILPYKLIAIPLTAFFGWDTNVSYKVSLLFFGQGLFLLGLFLLVKQVFKKALFGWVAVFLAWFTPNTQALLYQEQNLGTTFFLPFLWLFLLKARESRTYFVLFTTTLGLSLNSHYPQFIYLYCLFVLLGMLATPKRLFAYLRDLKSTLEIRWVGLALLGFSIAVSPLLYSYTQYRGKLFSPYRNQHTTIQATTYDNYLKMHQPGNSLRLGELFKYLEFGYKSYRVAPLDKDTLYATPAVAFALLLLLLGFLSWARFQAITLALLAIAAMGTHGWIPWVSWWIVPGIGYFREWYHFTAILNLHWLFLVLTAFRFFLEYKKLGKQETRLFGIGLFLVVCYWNHRLGLWPVIGALIVIAFHLMARQKHWSGSLAAASFFVWIALGSISWTEKRATQVKRYTRTQPPSHLYRKTARAHPNNLAMDDLYLHYRNELVVPRGLDYHAVREMGRQHPFRWWGLDGRFRIPDETDLSAKIVNGRYEIRIHRIPSDVDTLLWNQFDDGKWQVETGEGIPVARKENSLGTLAMDLSTITPQSTLYLW